MLTSKTGKTAQRYTKAAVKALKNCKDDYASNAYSAAGAAEMILAEYLKDAANTEHFRDDSPHGLTEKEILCDLLTAWRLLFERPGQTPQEISAAFRDIDGAIDALINPGAAA